MVFGLVIILTACERKNAHRKPASESCHNLTLVVHRLHPRDLVYLAYDTRMLLRYRLGAADTSLDKRFCNRYHQQGTFRLMIMSGDKVIQDASVILKQPVNGYRLTADRGNHTLIITQPD